MASTRSSYSRAPNPRHLCRYTELSALIHMLRTKSITLLDPGAWDDRTDAYFLQQYRKRKRLRSVLALCMTHTTSQPYHNWKVFAGSSSGVCIQFNKQELVEHMASHGVSSNDVLYRTFDEIRGSRTPTTEEMPYIKRMAYIDEREYRFLYESRSKKQKSLELPLDLTCIERITLSPWMPKSLHPSVKATLKGIKGCEDLSIYRSTLIDSQQWRDLVGGDA